MDERTTSRKIVHIDMDAFYASVEHRDDPNLRGKPVVVAWKGNRSVVCAASYEARKFGVRSAMPAITAERLCPEAIFVPPDFVRYKEASRGAREIFHRHTDFIEPLSLDEAYLDVTENKTGLPTATRVAKTIRQQIREELNLTASAGVAPNKFLAKIASDWRKPDGLFVIQPHEVQDFLLPLPVGRIPGVGQVTESRMKAVGIATVGDLYRLELSDLQNHFGSYGIRLYQLARGIDHNPVVANRVSKSISAEDTFSSRHTSRANRGPDSTACRKGMAGFPRQRPWSKDSRAQAQNEGVQFAHTKHHPFRPTIVVRRIDYDCARVTRTSRTWATTALPFSGRRTQQLST
jgi:DNA polymerase-4